MNALPKLTRSTGRSLVPASRRVAPAGSDLPDLVINDVIMNGAAPERRGSFPARGEPAPLRRRAAAAAVLNILPADAHACPAPRPQGSFISLVETVMRKDEVRSTVLHRL